MLGRVRDDSIAAGVMGSKPDEGLLRLAGEMDEMSVEDRFFEIRLAALSACLANFSSVKISVRVLMLEFAICAGLSQVSAQLQGLLSSQRLMR